MEEIRDISILSLRSKTDAKLFDNSRIRSTEEFLAAPELAMKLSLSVHTIRKWKAMGLIPYRRFGRAIRYKLDEVVEAMTLMGRN